MLEFWACNVSIREHQASALWVCGVRLQEHQASGARRESEPAVSRFGVSLLLGGKSQRIRSNCARVMMKMRRCQPSVVSLDIFLCNVTNINPRLFGHVVCPCGNTRVREHDASPRPRFLTSGPAYSLAETRKKPLLLHPKRVQHRWWQPAGSLVGHLGL